MEECKWQSCVVVDRETTEEERTGQQRSRLVDARRGRVERTGRPGVDETRAVRILFLSLLQSQTVYILLDGNIYFESVFMILSNV